MDTRGENLGYTKTEMILPTTAAQPAEAGCVP